MSEALPLPQRVSLSTPDGETLALRRLPAPGPARAVIVVVHGLGEHAGRYHALAECLHEWNFAVWAHDHYGHGESTGARGGLPSELRLVDDLALVIDDARRENPGLPLVLLGHSLGGLVAASLVARGVRQVDGLVLSSPGLDPGLNGFQKMLLAVLPRIAPDLRVGNGLDDNYLSHDPAVVQAYRDDPLTHDRIGGRLARFLAYEGETVQQRAASWPVPTLLLYAGDDRLVRPAASRAFASAAAPSGKVEAHCFDALYHELFNELEADSVFAALQSWLNRRFPPPA
ncbi:MULTISPECIES: alpha/beta hydrolase [unclassified Variovorax]|uniref:alpha/beta hydrolase n=1 Tax=unclassified Variovorax TaxID=663243 RepID=UPI000F7DBB39|nr:MULTISPECIES: alpha/beta hydrolase [unclassified Variovorax]RSZ38250.1 alpha/beta hydrolase [Variovorax sp. 553]RSZ39298.1 alpha/beta hydrolase [Variovorax sp. 679]